MVIAGIDEAGRGAVIGPLVVAGVSIPKENEHKLIKLNLKDSKLLSAKQREDFAKKIEKIAKDIIVVKVAACKIDSYRSEGINLNKLEAMKFADILDYLNPSMAYIDCPDTVPSRLELFLKTTTKSNSVLCVEHKADMNYPIVSAASIIAKVTRDAEVEKLKKEHKLDNFGSGYPSDPLTKQWMEDWLKTNKKFPDCVRKSWMTTEVMMANKEQSKLGQWLSKFKKQPI
ncbi:MAG: ribonuclease HII [Nanoarchaeota archaeon]